MQPYFFPYLGHFGLIVSVDRWIVFDVTQYTPKTWMNRNRILHPKSGWQYVTVPLLNSSNSIRTSGARILDVDKARASVLGKLTHYKKHAPFYFAVKKIVNDTFAGLSGDSLVALNVRALDLVCGYLGVPFAYQICSDLKLDYPDDMGPGDWAPFISEKLGATEYLNPAAGRDLFDPAEFEKRSVSLRFAEFSGFAYMTGPYVYEPGLSVLDVMMWNSATDIVEALHQGISITK